MNEVRCIELIWRGVVIRIVKFRLMGIAYVLFMIANGAGIVIIP